MSLPKDLLDILCCPLCRRDLDERGETLACRNAECGLVFPVKEGIPVMLIDEASRPCPKCSTTRDWKDDRLTCPSCKASISAERT